MRTSTSGTEPTQSEEEAGCPTDNLVKLRASESAERTRNLIAIENARSTADLKIMRAVGVIVLMLLVVIVLGAYIVIHAVAGMHLPFLGLVASTVLGGSGVSGLAFFGGRRLLTGRRQSATSESPPDDRTEEGNRDRAGAP
ncbi:hypothetical protein AB0M29_14070 [Streptomyces sp. NPDC051976]|uniref:hypothetical protein n=1 Tax=Streptomyces sp. NPDC051976 TaxID=3154947 RepID=UPI00341B28F7